MFRYQLWRLFRKLWYLLVAILVILLLTRVLAMRKAHYPGELSDEEYAELDRLCSETKEMSLDERYIYISNIPYDQNSPRSTAAAEYKNSLVNGSYAVKGVKDYLKSGEGFRSVNIPQDMNKYPELYKSLSDPENINDIYFKRFLRIAGYDLTPVFVLLLVGAFVADSCEKGIDRQIKTAKKRRSFLLTSDLTLMLTVIVLCVITTLLDLAFSGLLTHPEYLSASIHSVDYFIWFPQNITLIGAVLWVLVMEMIGSLICCSVFVFIARKTRDMKLYLIISSGFISAVTVASDRLPSVNLYGFIGINSKESIFLDAKYLPSLGTSTLLLPAIALGGMLLCICIVRSYRVLFDF